MRKARVEDWVTEHRRRKWRWAGHVVRREDRRWATRLLDWEPTGGVRAVGRPVARWEDVIAKFMKDAAVPWRELARDRDKWSSLEADFVVFAG